MPRPLGELYLVTERRLCEARGQALEDAVAAALGALPRGAAAVQLREKDLPAAALAALGRRVLAACRAHGAPMLVNDRLDVALAIGADGVHLPEQGLDLGAVRRIAGAGLVIGRSVHDPHAAGAAAADGVDLVVLGPIWATPSKDGLGAPLGPAALTAAAREVAGARSHARLVAIGGVDGGARVREARAAGAHGVAVIRAVFGASDPAAAARALI